MKQILEPRVFLSVPSHFSAPKSCNQTQPVFRFVHSAAGIYGLRSHASDWRLFDDKEEFSAIDSNQFTSIWSSGSTIDAGRRRQFGIVPARRNHPSGRLFMNAANDEVDQPV